MGSGAASERRMTPGESTHLEPPDLAIVIEWDTASVATADRGLRCLVALHRELHRFRASPGRGRPEVVIAYSPHETKRERLEAVLDLASDGQYWSADMRLLPVPGDVDYYAKKNLGFAKTRGVVVVFLDSDVVPEDGWLESMTAPLADYRVAVVVGNTYMDTNTFYARCVALFWIFDTRAAQPTLSRTPRLVSNCIAFRRSIFTKFPFPIRSTFRGQCSELATILASQGIGLHLNSGAQAAHPPPKGARRFVERAMFAGHDECSYQRLDGDVGARDAFARFAVDWRVVRGRVSGRRSAVGAGTFTALCATGLGAVYYSLKLSGYLLTLASPNAVRRMFA
jgi:hypothetical protein